MDILHVNHVKQKGNPVRLRKRSFLTFRSRFGKLPVGSAYQPAQVSHLRDPFSTDCAELPHDWACCSTEVKNTYCAEARVRNSYKYNQLRHVRAGHPQKEPANSIKKKIRIETMLLRLTNDQGPINRPRHKPTGLPFCST